jgi:hypothetical protein
MEASAGLSFLWVCLTFSVFIISSRCWPMSLTVLKWSPGVYSAEDQDKNVFNNNTVAAVPFGQFVS